MVVNDSLTLAGVPAEAFEYRLGNRSALEWVIDQYQVATDKRSGLTSDPNPADDPEYIARWAVHELPSFKVPPPPYQPPKPRGRPSQAVARARSLLVAAKVAWGVAPRGDAFR